MEDPAQPPPEDVSPDPEQVAVQRRTFAKRGEPEIPPVSTNDAALAGAIALLTHLYNHNRGGAPLPPLPEGEQELPLPLPTLPTLPTLPGQRNAATERLRHKRLQRTRAAAEGTGATSGERAEAKGGVAAPVVLGTMKPPPIIEPPRSPWVPVLAWVAGIGLLIGAIWAVYRSSPANKTLPQRQAGGGMSIVVPAQPTGEIKVSAEAMRLAGQIVDATSTGDWERAATLMADVRQRQIQVPGLLYQSALLALHRGQNDEAEHAMDASIDAHEFRAECCYLRASIYGGQGDYAAAADQFAEAVRVDPFDPKSYFYWGECLRRQGKPALAIDRFEDALKRRPSSVDVELILFKLNLAKVEAGTDAEFQTALTNRLAQEPVPANVLLLAAANEINRGHAPAATPYLQRAAESLSPIVYHIRIQDFAFRAPALGKELLAQWASFGPVGGVPPAAASVGTPTPAAPAGKADNPKTGIPLVDPATRNLTETDPANW